MGSLLSRLNRNANQVIWVLWSRYSFAKIVEMISETIRQWREFGEN